MITVIYATSSFLRKNDGQVGKMFEHRFASVEAAQKAPIPSDCEYALISTQDGHHTYSKTFGWEFHKHL